jgi:tetratricopeptide (TPR) repeat protein
MRAMEQLANLLRGEGISLDAIKVYERMLELNPNDNQGVRDPLLGLYLETGDLKGARELLDKFNDDASANFAWARVLERFLAGAHGEARTALKQARRANPHVELYLAARKTLPKHPPEMYSPGSEEEAVLSLDYLSGAWAAHKEAVFWLLDQLAADGLLPVPSKAGGRSTSHRPN